jgi:tetratricopeptide (TPR) repeat protein
MKRIAVGLCILVSTAIAAPKETAPKRPAKAATNASAPAIAKPPLPDAEPAKSAPKDDEAQRLHAEALRAFQKGDLTAAAAGFERVLAIAPENAPALINLALVRQRQKRFDDADQLLKRVLRNDGENASAWLLLGIAAYEQQKLDAAHAHLSQAVLYAPKNAQAHQYLGVTLGRKGWYSAGEEELRRAIAINPKFADAHYNLAVLCMERVPPAVELARRHYSKALELGVPPDPELAKKIGD